MLNMIFYIIIPYICLISLIIGLIVKITTSKLTISAPATGFFEKERLSIGTTSWHYGIVFVLIGHILGLLFPMLILELLSDVSVKVGLSILAITFGFSAFFGLIILIVRRLITKTVFKTTRFVDIFILCVLLIQVSLGIYIATNYRWGMGWYASNVAHYIYSIILLNPKVSLVSTMPFLVGLHFSIGFIIVGLIPYTRLIHFLYVPIGYIFKKPQLIIYLR